MGDVCRDFTKGRCFRSSCRFSHPSGMGAPLDYSTKGQPCRDFSMGSCHRGGSCKYSHDGAAATPGPGAAGYIDPTLLAATAMDPGVAAYYASLGALNPYAHLMWGAALGHQVVKPAPAAPAQQGNPNDLCHDFQMGKCNRGENCKFLHQKEICADFMRGKCAREDCRYSHDKQDANICRDFQRGACARGTECRFNHTEESVVGNPECMDFTRGACTRGAACKFRHIEGGAGGAAGETKQATQTEGEAESDGTDGAGAKRKRDDEEGEGGEGAHKAAKH